MKKELIASTREAFIKSLISLASEDSKIVLVCADSLTAVRGIPFAEKFPQRVFDLGIAEQNAVAFCSGLASCGYHPFFSTYAGFITMRACEQVRTFIAYPYLKVKFVGLNGGIYGGEREGVTHQFFEDLAIMRSIPGMDVLVPADAGQVQKATKALAQREGPGYLRIGSGREPIIFDEKVDFQFGKARVIEDYGSDAAIFSCGPILKRALRAAAQLSKEGIKVKVVEVHTIKPLDIETISAILQLTGVAVTVEDHSIIGGLGSAISEVIAEHSPATLIRIGLRDVFPESGEAEKVLDYFGMGINDIIVGVKAAIHKANQVHQKIPTIDHGLRP
jgi:transketolase